MDRFRRLFAIALLAGTASGLILFVFRHAAIVPLIDAAEQLEQAAAHAHAAAGHVHEDSGWQPEPGFQRVGLTAVTTVLTSIGFASILLAAMSFARVTIDARRGLLWGLAGFACFALAPALGLPAVPPGAAVGDLAQRQYWFLATVIATAAGLWLAAGKGHAWWLRAAGVAVAILPHFAGTPPPEGASAVPATLLRDFARLSLIASLIFWLSLGTFCGGLWHRFRAGGA